MDAMKESLKTATRNTMFDQWLEAVGNPIGWNKGVQQPETDSAEGGTQEAFVDLEQYLRRNLPSTVFNTTDLGLEVRIPLQFEVFRLLQLCLVLIQQYVAVV